MQLDKTKIPKADVKIGRINPTLKKIFLGKLEQQKEEKKSVIDNAKRRIQDYKQEIEHFEHQIKEEGKLMEKISSLIKEKSKDSEKFAIEQRKLLSQNHHISSVTVYDGKLVVNYKPQIMKWNGKTYELAPLEVRFDPNSNNIQGRIADKNYAKFYDAFRVHVNPFLERNRSCEIFRDFCLGDVKPTVDLLFSKKDYAMLINAVYNLMISPEDSSGYIRWRNILKMFDSMRYNKVFVDSGYDFETTLIGRDGFKFHPGNVTKRNGEIVIEPIESGPVQKYEDCTTENGKPLKQLEDPEVIKLI